MFEPLTPAMYSFPTHFMGGKQMKNEFNQDNMAHVLDASEVEVFEYKKCWAVWSAKAKTLFGRVPFKHSFIDNEPDHYYANYPVFPVLVGITISDIWEESLKLYDIFSVNMSIILKDYALVTKWKTRKWWKK